MTAVEKLEKAWGRNASRYSPNIYGLYADQALTGWVLLITEPVMAPGVEGEKCLAVDLKDWITLKTLGDTTITPFRVVAQGRGLIAKAFMPHVGLKYAVRETDEEVHSMLMPLEDFKSV